jgi:hypothetical protein
MTEYKVKYCRAEHLESSLNQMIVDGYEIDRYEHLFFDIETGVEWVVIGKRD